MHDDDGLVEAAFAELADDGPLEVWVNAVARFDPIDEDAAEDVVDAMLELDESAIGVLEGDRLEVIVPLQPLSLAGVRALLEVACDEAGVLPTYELRTVPVLGGEPL
jgi:hypothetical protein